MTSYNGVGVFVILKVGEKKHVSYCKIEKACLLVDGCLGGKVRLVVQIVIEKCRPVIFGLRSHDPKSHEFQTPTRKVARHSSTLNIIPATSRRGHGLEREDFMRLARGIGSRRCIKGTFDSEVLLRRGLGT